MEPQINPHKRIQPYRKNLNPKVHYVERRLMEIPRQRLRHRHRGFPRRSSAVARAKADKHSPRDKHRDLDPQPPCAKSIMALFTRYCEGEGQDRQRQEGDYG
jgi:hypothetical protein